MKNELLEVERNIRSLSDDRLLQMLASRNEYRAEAIKIAENEIRKRGMVEQGTHVPEVEADIVLPDICGYGWRRVVFIFFVAVVMSFVVPTSTSLLCEFTNKCGGLYISPILQVEASTLAIIIMWVGVIREICRVWKMQRDTRK